MILFDILDEQYFTEAINEVHRAGEVPPELSKSLILILHKKGSKSDLKNYRPIALLNTDLKIYTKFLANRLKSLLGKTLHHLQYAAPGKRKSSAINLVRDLFSSARKSQREAFIVSVDFQKALTRWTIIGYTEQWLKLAFRTTSLPSYLQ